MSAFTFLYDGLSISRASVDAYVLTYKITKMNEKIYDIKLIFRSGYIHQFTDVTEEDAMKIVEKLKAL